MTQMEQVEQGLRLKEGAERLTLTERMAHHGIPGVSLAVMDGGVIHWSRGYGRLAADSEAPVEPDHLFLACSIAKFATALTTLALVEAGELDLDADVNGLMRQWQLQRDHADPVTLRHLLAHQAGIIDGPDSFDWLPPGQAVPTLRDVLDGRSTVNPHPVRSSVRPATQFAYSDGGYCVVQQVLEERGGGPFSEIARTRLFAPLGLERSCFGAPPDAWAATGHTSTGDLLEGRRPLYPFPAAAGLWTTPSDLGRLALELMGALRGEGRLLSPALAKAMISPPWEEGIGLGCFGSGSRCFHFGWGRGFQGMLALVPEAGAGTVILTNSDPGREQMESLVGEIYRSVVDVYVWPK